MRDPRTHYNILRVCEQATDDELRAAFKACFLRFHPARFPGNRQRAAAFMEAVKESYSILSNPQKRSIYDDLVARRRQEEASAPPAGRAAEAEGQDSAANREHVEAAPQAQTGRRFSRAYPAAGILLALSAFLGWFLYTQDDEISLAELVNFEASDPQNQFVVENRCRYPVTLAIRYWGLDQAWHLAGWWDIAPGEAAYLEDEDGNRLISNNAIWYYYARTVEGASIEWRGRYPFIFDGDKLRMIELEDTAGDSELSLSCETGDAPSPGDPV